MNSKSKRICITGAAGNLGGLTARYLLEHTDYELNLMFHKQPLSQELISHERAHAFRCDLGQKETLVEALREVDEIIHFAGVLFRANPEKFLPLTNLAYFKHLLEIAQSLGVKKIILISFPHVEGHTSVEHPSTDRLDQTPVSVHAATRLEEEKLLLRRFPNSVVLRVGMVYGRGILMPDAARWLAQRRILCVWPQPTHIHLISKDDFLEVVKRTAANPQITGIYNIGDQGEQTLQEYLDFACEQWRCSRPWRVPLRMIYLAAWLCELVSRVFKTRSPLTGDFIDIGRVSYYGDTRRMQQDLMRELKYPTMKHGAGIF
jgi:nucleoside-diphosphate-sugar epimerase